MLFHKCKNSVFCACFFFFFLLGTICGTFAFRCLAAAAPYRSDSWSHPFFVFDPTRALWSFLRPMCVSFAFALHPQGHRALFVLISLRGFLTAFCVSALVAAGAPLWSFFAKELITLAIFFIISKWSYFRWDFPSFTNSSRI